MGAEFVDQAVTAFAVAERQQPFGEELHPHRRTLVLGKFLRQQRWNPVAAEKPSAGRAGAGLGQEVVLFFAEHAQARCLDLRKPAKYGQKLRLRPFVVKPPGMRPE